MYVKWTDEQSWYYPKQLIFLFNKMHTHTQSFFFLLFFQFVCFIYLFNNFSNFFGVLETVTLKSYFCQI